MIHENSTLSYDQQKIKGKTEVFRRKVWELLNKGLFTDREVMTVLNENDVNNIRPEITRLKQDGLVIEKGKIICPITRKRVRISTATENPYFSRGNKKRTPDEQG